MAGLRHNLAAGYCVKRAEDVRIPVDPEARCDYCDSKGLGPVDATPEGGDRPQLHSVEPTTEESRPAEPGLIAQFLERLGVTKGCDIYNVRTVDGDILPGARVIDVAALSLAATGTLDVVITLVEPGLRAKHRIRWSQITSFVN